jgi:hypothetical protein
MAGNHLESLVAEWYEFRGYFVRRNVKVGKRPNGGYECELDIVAFHPEKKELVQIEPSLDSDKWLRREERYRKKFEAGERHIPALFSGIPIPKHVDQIALFVYGGGENRTHVGGGRVIFIKDFMREIHSGIIHRKVNSAAVPEEFPLLRTLQFAAQYWGADKITKEKQQAMGTEEALSGQEIGRAARG